MKSLRSLYFSTLGLLGGVSSWVMLQNGFHFTDALSMNNFNFMQNVVLINYFLEGALVGLGLGMIFHVRVSLWYHQNLVLIFTKMFLGALFGAIIGLFSFAFGYFLQFFEISLWLSRITSWTILGVFLLVTTELFRLDSGFVWPRIVSGGIGGLIGGVIFELLLLYQISGPDHLYGLIILGFSISFFTVINENRVTSFALRVLSGPQEGQIFLLDQNKFTLGYGSGNDFILNGYAEMCNHHARILKTEKQVFIENLDPDSETLVNYRTVDHQAIKKGDVIKIGTALLQYYEI